MVVLFSCEDVMFGYWNFLTSLLKNWPSSQIEENYISKLSGIREKVLSGMVYANII